MPPNPPEPHLALDPRDWFRATWRTLEPLPRTVENPPTRPVDVRIEPFRKEVIPTLSPEERDLWFQKVRKVFGTAEWPSNSSWQPPARIFELAAALGVQPEIDALVDSWPDDAFAESWLADEGHPQELVLGQSSAERVERHMRRLKLSLRTPEQIRAWFAHTELRALDLVISSVQREKKKGARASLTRALGLARCEETARAMIELAVSGKDPVTPREWLERWPHFSAGPLAEASRGRGKAAALAGEVLRAIGRGKGAALVADVLPTTPQTTSRVPEMESLPPFLEGAGPLPKLPWPPLDELPPLVLGTARLPAAGVVRVLSAMSASKLETPHEVLAPLAAAVEPASIDRFVCRLLELFEGAGAPNKLNWVIVAAGLCGRQRAAMALGRAAKPWRLAKRHQAASLAIDALAKLGNDEALGELRKFTQINRDWAVIEVARHHLLRIAEARGLTHEDLEDRSVPDCGLDERGGCAFDFGPRTFELVLGADLKPRVRDGGKLRADLPTPNASDDPVKAQAAVEAWKLLKKSLPAVSRSATARLETALVTGRTWRATDFEHCLVRHPVVGHLVRGLLWSRPGNDACFRVAEDSTYAGPDDEAVTLDPDERVCLAHPALLAPEALETWAGLFADYRVVQPFPQLGRPVARATPAEQEASTLVRFTDIPCLGIGLLSGLEKLGWRRDVMMDGGVIALHTKTVRGLDAVLTHTPGIFIGDVRGAPDQTLEGCTFYTRGGSSAPVPLGAVDPVAFSEVVLDLTRLTAR
jgi:hypothetical protein